MVQQEGITQEVMSAVISLADIRPLARGVTERKKWSARPAMDMASLEIMPARAATATVVMFLALVIKYK